MSSGRSSGDSMAAPARSGALGTLADGWFFPALGLVGVAFSLLLVFRYGSFALVFLPAALLTVPFLASRFLTKPAPVFALYILLIINLDFVKLGGGRLTLDVLTSAVLLYALIARLLLEGKRSFTTSVEKGYILYLGLTFISVILSVDKGESVKNWGRDLQYLFMFAFLYGLDLTRKQKRMIVGAAVCSVIIPCVLGLIGLKLGISRFLGVVTPVEGGKDVARIAGTLSHPVVFAEYLSFMIPVTAALLWDGTWFRRRYLGALLALQLLVLYLTYGRTGWGACAVGLVAVCWLLGYRRVIFLAVPVVVFGLIKVVPNFAGRIENAFQANDNSLLWRIGLWAYAITFFPRRPFFGSGPGTFLHYISYSTGFAAHQTWMNLLIETGLVGLAGFLVLLGTVFRSLTRKHAESVGIRDPLVVGVYGGLIGIMSASLTGDPFNLPAVSLYLWTFLAIALRPGTDREEPETPR